MVYNLQITRGPFATFVDSPYYSHSEPCGGAVTVSFSKYLPWQVMYFLQRSAHFSKTCCRPLITSKFLVSELPFRDWKSPEIAWGEVWTVWRMFQWGSTDPLFPSRTQNSIQISPHGISGVFQSWKGSSETRNFEVINGVQHVFEKWVVRCKKGMTYERSYFEKETCHRTSTKFRLRAITWVHELFKRPLYLLTPQYYHSERAVEMRESRTNVSQNTPEGRKRTLNCADAFIPSISLPRTWATVWPVQNKSGHEPTQGSVPWPQWLTELTAVQAVPVPVPVPRSQPLNVNVWKEKSHSYFPSIKYWLVFTVDGLSND
jgi:hypothetical protein